MLTESPSSAGPEESRRIPEAFADKGGNYFDTANEVYSAGLSERIPGSVPVYPPDPTNVPATR